MPLAPRTILNTAGRYLPPGEFLLPICTNRDRALALISALNYATATRPEETDFAEILTDVMNAVYYAQAPSEAPCNDCGGDAEPGDCYEFTPAVLDEIYPNNPYTGEETEGEPNVWFIGPAINLTGAPEGSLTTDLAQTIPGGGPSAAGIVLHTRAAATIEFHFHAIILGGLVLVTVDDDPLTLQTVDLHADLTAVPPEIPGPVIIEVTVPGGEHYIRCAFVPWLTFQGEAILVPQFGGALTKIVVCAEDIMSVFREPQLRFTEECGLEVSYDDGETWTPVSGWSEYAADCFEGPPGPAGADGAPGEDCECPEPGGPIDPDAPYGWPEPEVPPDNTRCEVAYGIVESVLSQFRTAKLIEYDVLVTEVIDLEAWTTELELAAAGAYLSGASYSFSAAMWANALRLFAASSVMGIAAIINNVRVYFDAVDILALEDVIVAAEDTDVIEDYACALFNLMVDAGVSFPTPAVWTAWIDYVLFNNPSDVPDFNQEFWHWLAIWRAPYFTLLDSLPAELTDGDNDCEPCRRVCPDGTPSADAEDGTFYGQPEAIDFTTALNPYAFPIGGVISNVTNGFVSSGGTGIGSNACNTPSAIRNSWTGAAVAVEFPEEVCVSSMAVASSSNNGLWGGGWWYFVIAEGADGVRRIMSWGRYTGTGGSVTTTLAFDDEDGRAAAFPCVKLWFCAVLRTNGASPGTVASRCVRISSINGTT